jgi:bifunctional DNA-binding transcriptional regulator/antitoxin component of YhaV-PrlF toxin-antitoxin module
VTSKGQVTLPKKLRNQLAIQNLLSINLEEGQGILKKTERASDVLAGSFHPYYRRNKIPLSNLFKISGPNRSRAERVARIWRPLARLEKREAVLTVSLMTVTSIRSGDPSKKLRDRLAIQSLLSDMQEGEGILKKTERYSDALAGSFHIKCQVLTRLFMGRKRPGASLHRLFNRDRAVSRRIQKTLEGLLGIQGIKEDPGVPEEIHGGLDGLFNSKSTNYRMSPKM